jgi:sialate O-acetylesterase
VQQELNVPIGLLNSCVGGSSIESWMRIEPGNLPADPAGKKREYGKLYRERIALLVGYGMRGALWYQGEANSNEGHEYFLKMESMISDWRASWDLGDFPFYIVQLAGISESPMDDPAMGDGRARIREAQRHVLTMKHTGMAVAVDIGEKKDYVSPVPVPDAKLPWLSIQAKDGTWHWAEARIDSSDLIVSSKDAKEPIAVRYAYTNHPDGVYLYNAAGLPASPFATDTKNE